MQEVKKVKVDPKKKAAESREANRLAEMAKTAKGSAALTSFFKKK